MNILDLQYDFGCNIAIGEKEFGEESYAVTIEYMPEYHAGIPTRLTETHFLTQNEYLALEDGLTALLHKMAMFRKENEDIR